MNNPTLSIITPVFNGERYLRRFIQSVIDQHCSQIEHIFVDGASQDNSVNIIKEFAAKHSHIRVISEKDSGTAEAMNKGIVAAKAPFISILCLDDFHEPGVLNEVVNLLPDLPHPAFLVGNCNVLNEQDEIWYINKPTGLTPLGMLMEKAFPHNPVAYFYHKELHKKVGFYKDCHQSDVDFLLRVLGVAKVHYVDKCFGNFRTLPDSITVKLKETDQLKDGRSKIFAEYLATRSALQRAFMSVIIRLNKETKVIYFLERLRHYFLNPKDILRYLCQLVKGRR